MQTIQNLDLTIFRFINNLAGSASWFNPVAIFFAEYAIFALALFMFILWLFKRQMRKPLIIAFVAFIVAAIVAKLSGRLFYHLQPFAELEQVYKLIPKEVGNAFPSDHTAAAFAVCVTLCIGSKSKWRPLYILFATLIGLARIWVGVHYPIDVLAGALIGTLVAFMLYPLLKRFKLIDNFISFYEKIEMKLFGAPARHRQK